MVPAAVIGNVDDRMRVIVVYRFIIGSLRYRFVLPVFPVQTVTCRGSSRGGAGSPADPYPFVQRSFRGICLDVRLRFRLIPRLRTALGEPFLIIAERAHSVRMLVRFMPVVVMILPGGMVGVPAVCVRSARVRERR